MLGSCPFPTATPTAAGKPDLEHAAGLALTRLSDSAAKRLGVFAFGWSAGAARAVREQADALSGNY